MSDHRLGFFDASAVLFDLDGVVTPTADVHMRAWATMFQRLFAERDVTPPYTDDDYFRHLDGRPRYEGVASLLASRDLDVPWGDPDDPDDADTVCGIGNRKNAVFTTLLEREGIAAYPGTLAVLDRLAAAGTPVAIVSSSKNAVPVLAAANLADRFPVVVDGVVAADLGLPGKPRPDIFLEGARRLHVEPEHAVVVEDAISGVQAGAAGGFGLVVGVDRGVGADELAGAGADVVVPDLADLLPASGGEES